MLICLTVAYAWRLAERIVKDDLGVTVTLFQIEIRTGKRGKR